MKNCPKCNTLHYKSGIFCSRQCANSRGPRSEDFKNKVRSKLKGKPLSAETIEKMKLSKPRKNIDNKICPICNNIYNTEYKTCSWECRNKLIGINSHENKNCGGARRSKRFIIKNILNEEFILDSSYELKFASILNKKNIVWTRPEHFKYVDMDGKKRRYHPDFFIPSLNKYFDTKNDYLMKKDEIKIKLVSTQNLIEIEMLSLSDIISWDHP